MMGNAIGQYKRAVMLISSGLSHPSHPDASTVFASCAIRCFIKDDRASKARFLPVVPGWPVFIHDKA